MDAMDPMYEEYAIPQAIRPAFAAQRAIIRALHRDQMPPDWAQLDLSMGQLKALMVLSNRQPMNVSGLAETLALSKPTASILVDRLVQLGFAERTEDAEDRRRTLVTPTPAGAALVLRLRQGSVDRLIRWMSALDPDDLAALTRGLRAVATAAERDGASLPEGDAASSPPGPSPRGQTGPGVRTPPHPSNT